MNAKFAKLISTIFEPMIVVYVVALVGGRHAGLLGDAWVWYALYLTIFISLVTLVRVYFASRYHTNWDISDRKKRVGPLVALMVVFGLHYFVVRNIDNASLTWLFILFMAWTVGFFLITLKTKLSGHLSVFTLALCIILKWYGVVALPLLLLIPILSWSRIQLKRHTMKEVLIGIGYSSILFVWLN